MRALIVEDELRLAENVAAALREGAGLAVDRAETGTEGEELLEAAARAGSHDAGSYDLVILDLMLPGLSGLALLRKLRARGDRTPVLILTAREGAESVIELLNAGADDYLSKPFDLGELLARAKALIRRGKGNAHPVLRVGEVEINTLEQTVVREGRAIETSPTEFRILEYLAHRPRAVVSKQELLEHLYDFNWQHHSNVIEAHVSNLRRKLDRGSAYPMIETLRNRGYRLAVPAAGGK